MFDPASLRAKILVRCIKDNASAKAVIPLLKEEYPSLTKVLINTRRQFRSDGDLIHGVFVQSTTITCVDNDYLHVGGSWLLA